MNRRIFPRTWHGLALFTCLLATAALCAWAEAPGYTLIAPPHPDDPLQAVHYRLDNGLEVFLSVNRDTPRFFAEIAVRAGSKHDPPETTGLAHYMEHLLFKGSERLGTLDFESEKVHLDRIAELYEAHFEEKDTGKRRALYEEITRESTQAAAFASPNEFDRVYRAMGGRGLNAHTWHEEVVYKIDLPANRLEQWAVLESDRFASPVFRLFQTELETVYEEMNRSLDNKDRIIQRAVAEQLFKKHPYGQQPTLGLVDHLKSPSIKRLQDFYEVWYSANNMAIFISGDIDPIQTMETIAKHFSGWEARELPAPVTWEEAPLDGREEVRVRYQAEEFVLLAFRTAPRNHADAEALMMIDMILDNSVAGLINLNLNQQQRVREAGAFPLLLNDYGAQYLYGVPKDNQTMEEVEQLLLEQLASIRAGDFEEWILSAIINDYKKREKTSLESDADRVALMRRAWIGFEDWDKAFRIIERMEKLTREEVIRVANTYFGDNYVAGFREDAPHSIPEVEKPPMPDITIDPSRQSPFADQVMAMEAPPIEPVFLEADTHFSVKEVERGFSFYHTPNPINDVFSLAVVVDYGTRQDNRMAIASRLLQRTGTERFTPEELQIAWYKLGTDFSIAVEDNQTVVSLVGLDETFEASFALLMEMFARPRVDAQALDALKKIILVQREDARKDPGQISAALVEYNRYEANSTFLKMLDGEGVLALEAGELQELLRSMLGYRQQILYTGTLPLDTLVETVSRLHLHQDTLAPPPPYQRLQVRAPESDEIVFLNREMAQSHIRLEFGSVPYDPRISPAVQLYNMYFSGSMAGIVFQELREVRALAYIVGARYLPGARAKDQNIMLGVIQTQADKTIEAITAFADLMDNLPLSAERYAFARDALINDYRSNRISFRQIPQTLLDWKRRELEPDPRAHWYAAVLAADDMMLLESFHREHIAGNPKLISIVGETARVDLAALEALAAVKAVAVEDIFVE